jgi:A/G-specific adenine glycosylase
LGQIAIPAVRAIRKNLIRWYEKSARDLPWRRTRDPYAIWISEIMLQQTRVAAVIPYYQRFLSRFPAPAALAHAPEPELLTMWAGLGYYSRARNLQIAAKEIFSAGAFPNTYESLLKLRGIGSYTAAAVASIAFDLPHAAVDGNVKRVVVRLANDGRADETKLADLLLDRQSPGQWNQAMMELGATICLPREPLCLICPLAKQCCAKAAGTQNSLPLKRTKPTPEYLQRTILIIRRDGKILLTPSERVKGFWDLPETFRGARMGAELGEFKHTITHRHYRFVVREATAAKAPKGTQWVHEDDLSTIPLGTTAKKALHISVRS